MNSSLIGGLGDDAAFIAEHLAQRCSVDPLPDGIVVNSRCGPAVRSLQ
jgi:hypothetical protein